MIKEIILFILFPFIIVGFIFKDLFANYMYPAFIDIISFPKWMWNEVKKATADNTDFKTASPKLKHSRNHMGKN